MSSTKDLFKRRKVDKVLAGATLNTVGRGIESPDYVKANIQDKKRFIPPVDFLSASNFAIYGSAEKYYADSVDYIVKQYPYDGSEKEKIQWSLSGSYLDRHIFENEYPRTNGYVVMGRGAVVGSATSGLDLPTTKEYISIKGSPKPALGKDIPTGSLSTLFDTSNLYNTSSTGRYNLEINGDNGFAVEFWWKKASYAGASSEGKRQVIFDLWNSGTAQGAVDAAASGDWGRFTVEIDPGNYFTGHSDSPAKFYIRAFSGSDGFSSSSVYRQGDSADKTDTLIPIGQNLVLTGANWTHYAINVFNTGSEMAAELYVNGIRNERVTTGSSINPVTGAMLGTIGALVGKTYGGDPPSLGSGWLSASLDDFRYWRKKRSAEQIGKYWFTQVGGGTNTDITNAATASTKYSYENPVDLGLYYKFNEGIVDTTASVYQDSIVLDYSGRTTNGIWTGYTVGSRFTGSAITEVGAASAEFKDPIIRLENSLVSKYLTDKKQLGRWWDQQNNASLYGSLPDWIKNDDLNVASGQLRNLTQIIASYFDTLQLQIKAVPGIKHKEYISGSDKPYPFAERFLESSGFITSEIFSKATDLEYLANRNDVKNFTLKLNETKNLVYQNIYNILVYLYKTKGTDKSFRNLIRCFGVGEELVKINLYGDNVKYEIKDNVDYTVVKKRYADFHDPDRFTATIVQTASTSNTNSQDVISAGGYSYSAPWGHTYEAEIIFPKKIPIGVATFTDNFQTASIFGCHQAVKDNPNWPVAGSDAWALQIESVRKDIRTNDAYFRLTASAGRKSGEVFPFLTSSLFKDVYDNSKWNFAVRITPNAYPWTGSVSGSTTYGATSGDTKVEFIGYNYVLDYLVNSFSVSGTISASYSPNWTTLTTYPQRFYVGAHRTNWTGSVLEQSNVKASSFRVWWNSLSDDELRTHAQDAANIGVTHPYQNSEGYLSNLDSTGQALDYGQNVKAPPSMDTLILNWDFATVTSSDASGQFIVPDVSSGSADARDTNRYANFSKYAEYQHLGLGYGFPVSSTGSIDRRYIHTAKRTLPEVINSSDMVNIIGATDDKLFTRETRPIQYFFSFEKSMSNVISEEMVKLFATIVDFNNLIGDPVNRYRQEYKQMEKLRELYFDKVQNAPDLEKFVEFFKWIDSSVSVMLQQLVPGSAKFSETLRNMVESHILERNKYWNKFPTLEMKASDPEAGVRGINELLYSWKRGHAPIPNTLTGTNCSWWFERTERDEANITSGDSTVDSQRDKFRLMNDHRSGSGPSFAVSRDSTSTTTTYKGSVYAIRNFTKPWRLTIEELPAIRGGSNFPSTKRMEYINSLRDLSQTFKISASSVVYEKDCNDVIDPNLKNRLEYKFLNINDLEGYSTGKGTIFAPFSLFSSSVVSGYVSDISTNFRTKTDITNYHGDYYGTNEVPMQGPFTEKHVGGRQHRHIDINTASVDDALNRAEAWNLTLGSELMTIAPPIDSNTNQPRAVYTRDEYAKRPINIRNIKWGTSSQAAGNYRKDYEIFQTSGRSLNNRFFVDNEGFSPQVLVSPYVSGVVDFELPRYDLSGANKSIFVERFSAPGGPEVNSRGSLDIYAEEYSVYNEMNQRNLIVRSALKEWQTKHCGQFGIDPTGTVGDGTIPSEHTANASSYDGVIGAYHKVNRNPLKVTKFATWRGLMNLTASNNGLDITKNTGASVGYDAAAWDKSTRIEEFGYVEFIAQPTAPTAGSSRGVVGLNDNPPAVDFGKIIGSRGVEQMDFAIEWLATPSGGGQQMAFYVIENGTYKFSTEGGTATNNAAWEYGDRFRIKRRGNEIFYQHASQSVGSLPGDTEAFETFYQSTAIPPPVLFVDYAAVIASTILSSVKIGLSPQYDNWFVQHSIPQDDLRYAWISDSYDDKKDQPHGHASSFSVPSASISTTASSVQFITASAYDFPGISDGKNYSINFVNMFSYLKGYDADSYKYQLDDYNESWYLQTNVASFEDTNGITFRKNAGGAGWNAGATGRTPILEGGFVEFEAAQTSSYTVLGLTAEPPLPGNEERVQDITWGIYLLPYQFHNNNVATDGRIISPRENLDANFGGAINDGNPIYHAGDKFRVQRQDGKIHYQYSLNGGGFTTFYTSTILPSGSIYADFTLYSEEPTAVKNVNVKMGTNIIVPGYGFVSGGSDLAGTINAYFNNINGPYGYPSWKQIRTGEHPIARYQRRNNILSVAVKPSFRYLPNPRGKGFGNDVNFTYFNERPDSFTNFVEPPVSFKHKPLVSYFRLSPPVADFFGVERTEGIVNWAERHGMPIRHTYGNNLSKFSQCGGGRQNIAQAIGIPEEKDDSQMYDQFRSFDAGRHFKFMSYKEVVYPREANTGLKKTRQRTQYAEVAFGSISSEGTGTAATIPVRTFSASLSDGLNGIDYGPTERRTFWRDLAIYRNRRLNTYLDLRASGSPHIETTLPNSQGYKDGHATSVNGWGNTPIAFSSMGYADKAPRTYLCILSSSIPDAGVDPWQGGATAARFLSPTGSIIDFPDTGELNSVNYAKIASLFNVTGALFQWDILQVFMKSQEVPLLVTMSLSPTASAYYNHCELLWRDNAMNVLSKGQFRWRVAELSGKKPWFDSYEDYIDDIRGISKKYTIVPEFRISEHMPYYSDGIFQKRNDKFLSLNGAEITSSAAVVTQSNRTRGFNKIFFNEYSNTDFQKYFGKFGTDYTVDSITLKCNAVKKLLPYHGFYPSHRTLQLASLFSQSIAPHIGGIAWSSGSHYQADRAAHPPSGALAVQSLLQPFFAPGVLYNTIKSGIAVDWGCYTGSGYSSASVASTPERPRNTYIGTKANYRMPFEALLHPLGDVAIPVSSSNGEGKMNLLYPSYKTFANPGTGGGPTSSLAYAMRDPYFDLEAQHRNVAADRNAYTLYQLAMNNFLAEIPNFFLREGKLKTIVSRKQGEIDLEEGKTYYMDIYLQKDKEVVMIQDYCNGLRSWNPTNWDAGVFAGFPSTSPLVSGNIARSFNGKFFGPQVVAGITSSTAQGGWGWYSNYAGDPAYAQYTPPYFYGKSKATIAYTATDLDVSGGFSFGRLFNKSVITYSNPELSDMFHLIGGSNLDIGSENFPDQSITAGECDSGSMTISSSLNLFGLFQEKQVRYDGNSGRVIEVVDDPNSDRNRWVISPRMETPVLNFASQPEEMGYGRGMWSGYGELLTGSRGVTFGIEKSKTNQNRPSLIDKCFTSKAQSQQIGEIADHKWISEAVVAIPFLSEPQELPESENKFAETVNIMGKNFFKIYQPEFDFYRDWYLGQKESDFSASPDAPARRDQRARQAARDRRGRIGGGGFGVPPPPSSTSAAPSAAPAAEHITSVSLERMLMLMDKYIIPPELDFLTFAKGGRRGADVGRRVRVNPFVMYIFEFNHMLEAQDLADIWQGVMPNIARTGQLSSAGVDNNTFTHPVGPNEFFHGRKISDDVRWMVFKVKQKANFDYFKMTADTTDDSKFSFKFNVGDVGLPYSYNWPYDYFSLVEMVELETEIKFKK